MAAHPCALLAQTGVGEGGIPHPHPRSCAPLACVSGTQGAGVVPRAGFPCPVEVQAMPPLVKRGWEGGAAASPALIVLSDEWGRVAKSGEGCVPFGCRPTHPVCAQRRGANPARGRGREQGAPAHVAGARTGGGHAASRGEDMQTVFSCPLSLFTPVRVPRCTQNGRARRGCRREGGRGREEIVYSSHASPTRLQADALFTHVLLSSICIYLNYVLLLHIS